MGMSHVIHVLVVLRLRNQWWSTIEAAHGKNLNEAVNIPISMSLKNQNQTAALSTNHSRVELNLSVVVPAKPA